MRLRGVKSGIFHRSRCEYIQEWMRLVSEKTEEDATSFDERAASIGALFLCQGHSVAAEKRAEFGAGLIVGVRFDRRS
jgi:hypothetical protein